MTASGAALTTALSALPSGDNTLIAIFKTNGGSADLVLYGGHNGGSAVYGFWRQGTTIQGLHPGVTFSSSATDDGTPRMVMMTRSGVNASMLVDGTAVASSSSATSLTLPNATVLGREEASGGRRYWNGAIAEVLAFNSQLSTADRQRIEGYLAWKWKSVNRLPAGHPFKYSAPTSF